jgi:NAD+ kinase
LIGVSAKVGGDYVTTYVGDGLILSTAVGSTAYSLAAGGPILSPDLDALVLTPLAPHALPVRPLVVHASKGIEMRVEGKPGTEIGSVTLDGQVLWSIAASDVLQFEVSPVRFRLLSLEGSSFFKILRRKFGWTGSPRYER